EQYYNPPNMHPSLPNYLWLEAGTNFGIFDDNDPSQNAQSTSSHLVNLLEAAGISWKTYQEDEGSGAFDGTYCPIGNDGNYYDVNHNPFVYFDDGALFIAWDEGASGDGPIGMIVLSPKAKGTGYANTVAYDHSSTLRTVEEIFGVTPMLGGAASATDLRDLFVTFP